MYPSKDERADIRRTSFFAGRHIATWVVAGVVLVAVLAIGWATFVKPVLLDRDAHNRRASYERQDTDRDEIVKLWTQYTGTDPADTVHRQALMNRMCQTYGEVRGSLGSYPDITAALADCP